MPAVRRDQERDEDTVRCGVNGGASPRRVLASLVRQVGAARPRAAGASPPPVRRTAPGPGPRPTGEEVHLYLDVSGSVEEHLGKLSAAVRHVAHLVWRDVHLFSTDVEDVPVGGLVRGVCQTTGGTSLEPVVRHLREHRVRRAVLVTDGQVGCLGARDRETLGEVILGVALTSGQERDGELAGLARHVVVLPGL